MTGSFDSGEQAKNYSDYYDISLHMVPIWPEEKGTYMYVEQAVTAMPEKPYRQRVYVLEEMDGDRFSSAVYSIPDDSLYIGAWKTPEDFDQIKPTDLKVREGCAVILERTDETTYEGSTVEDKCKSTLRGATYATSKVSVNENGITSWDQGFDAEGVQVWGAEKGPYIFKRK